MTLTVRQAAAILALEQLGAPAGASNLSARMSADGCRTSTAEAATVVRALTGMGLAAQRHRSLDPCMRWGLTEQGRRAAEALRARQDGAS